MKITTFILIIFLFSSCGHNENWKEFQAKGIPTSDNSYQVLEFVDNNQIYLGGHKTETIGKRENQYIFEKYCVLYKSSDLGKTWVEINLGKLKGEIHFIRKNQNDLVILNQSVSSDSTTSVLKSNDNGKSWNLLYELSNKHFISDIYQRPNGTIELNARVNKNNLREVFRISNQKIDTIRFQPKIRHLHFSVNGFIGVQINENNSKSLVHFNLDGKETNRKTIETENIYSYSKRTSNNDILWYKNYSSSNIIIFRDNEFYEIDLSTFKDYNVKEPFIEDSLIIIDGFYDKDVAFLGVIHTFLVSHDFGKTWKEENAPSSMLVGPSDLNEGHFISNTSISKFQERK